MLDYPTFIMSFIQERLASIQNRIEAAAQKSGRSLKDIEVVAVTKGISVERILEAQAAGISVFGENRVQEAEVKIPAVQVPGLEWHMIGHVQSNKVKTTLALFGLIQSVDSIRLAKNISGESQAQNKVTRFLLEVNISGQPQRFGFSPQEIYGAVQEITKLPAIHVLGLMGMAPNKAAPGKIRESFKTLRNIFSVLKTLKSENLEMKYLSMGMSDDFEIAIEEGSNMIRLGRALFS